MPLSPPPPRYSQAIRDWIAANVDQKTADEIRIQYGGSANAKNAPDLSACPDIDGFLVRRRPGGREGDWRSSHAGSFELTLEARLE